MGRSKVVGVDAWYRGIANLSNDAVLISKRCVYFGADMVADGIRKAIEGIPSRDAEPKKKTSGITDVEREGLLDSLGIAPFEASNGTVHTKIGFDGYNNNITKKYPKGHPNSMVARSIESGTSFLRKTPFIAPTVRRLRASVQEAMQAELDKQIQQRSNK